MPWLRIFLLSVLLLPLAGLPAQEPDPLGAIRRAFSEGRVEDAERLLDELLTRDPAQREARLLRADLRANTGRHAEAIEDASRVLEQQPDDAKALTIRGATRIQTRDYAGAAQDLDQAVRLAPKEPVPRRWRGVVRHLQRDFRGAEADETAALQLDPKYVDALVARAESRSELKNLTGAMADADRIVELAPLDPRGRVVRSQLAMRLGRFRAALDDAAKAYSLAPAWPETLQMRASAFLAVGDWRSAVADMRVLLEREVPEADYLRLFIWTAQLRAGEQAAADREIQEYASARPITGGDDWSARLIRFACGLLEEADILKASTELRGRASPEGQQAEACFYAAMRRLAQDDRAGAIRLLKRAVASKADQYTEYQLALAFLPELERPAKRPAKATPKPAPTPKKKPKGGSDPENRPV
ncbi:MAG: tetratricopeptide repeat protein [Verrucomicrobia bacterium]|nr:tetratricopeptide repeat protein [Verrucomicrobiota bacterium]